MSLPTDDKARKAIPIWSGFVMYFPDVLAAVAEVSRKGNDQHNPGEPLHWAREKSTDQMNAALRHMVDHARGNRYDTDGSRHLAKAIWRLCAELQLDIENSGPAVSFSIPRRAITPECSCGDHSGPGVWGCERALGHPGNHMAWDDEAKGILYENGEWS